MTAVTTPTTIESITCGAGRGGYDMIIGSHDQMIR